MFITFASLESTFLSEVGVDLTEHPLTPHGVFSEEDLQRLPEPVQRYFRYCGYLNQPKMLNAQVHWKDVFLKLAPDKDWTFMNCYQYNAVSEPTRLAYMKSKLLGLLPLEGRDKYQHRHGQMLIRLLRSFTVTDARGPEMDASGLVTILAEALLIPSYALQPYVTWKPVNTRTAEASLTYGGLTVHGTFHFNEKGEMALFESSDRNYTEKDGTYRKERWSASTACYLMKNGILFPGEIRARWHLESGNYEYFKGKITGLTFNVHHFVIQEPEKESAEK